MSKRPAFVQSDSSKVLFVISDVTERVAPLAAGYLRSSASVVRAVRDYWEFQQYVCTSSISPETLARDLLDADADLYAFSCYVWNMRLFRTVLPVLLAEKPNAHVILGGPQVMHCADKYLDPQHERLVLCNGEGELTFREYLCELIEPEPDLSRVKGLSFYSDGNLITTEAQQRIRNLDEIPSPYLNGYIDPDAYTNAHLETNRGCPFKCQYCYWGGAVAAKVNKMDEERIKEEITWLAKNNFFFIFIVDANFGMLERDVRIAQHIASCREEHGLPMEVGFCSSKNTPERVGRITKIFHEADLLTTQSIALQTMSQDALVKVSRDNIKRSTYERLQVDLNQKGVSSYIEMIWPLPGETFESLRSGVTQLCESEAESIVCYPLLLMNNVELNEHIDEYGIVTERTLDPSSEAELVVQTKEVSKQACLDGWRFICSLVILYDVRGLYALAHYLHRNSIRSYGDLILDFAQYLKGRTSHTLSQICEKMIDVKSIEFSSLGKIVHYVCHEDRPAVDRLLEEFVVNQFWWNDATAQTYFEADLVNRMYAYAMSGFERKAYNFKHLSVPEPTSEGYVVVLPDSVVGPLRDIFGEKGDFESNLVHVRHVQKQLPYMKAENPKHNYLYCMHKLNTIGEALPRWEDYYKIPARNEEASSLVSA